MDAVLLLNWDQLSGWEQTYRRLLKRGVSVRCRLFLSPDWLTAWWRHCGSGRPLFLLFVNGSDLVGAAPLFVRAHPALLGVRLVRFIGAGSADYGDLVVDPNRNDVDGFFWEWLRENRHLWDVVLLEELPEESRLMQNADKINEFPPLQFCALRGEICRWIFLGHGDGTVIGSSWRHRISPSLQRQLGRRERQLTRLFTVRHQLVQCREEVAPAMGLLFSVHRLRWATVGQTGVFLHHKVRQFLTDFAERSLKQGWLRLHCLYLDDRPAGVYLAFRDGEYSGFYTCGFDPRFSRWSVGKVLLAKVLDEAEAEGASFFDFMRGDETYKKEFGARASQNSHLLVWQKDRARSVWAARLLRLGLDTKKRLKRRFQR